MERTHALYNLILFSKTEEEIPFLRESIQFFSNMMPLNIISLSYNPEKIPFLIKMDKENKFLHIEGFRKDVFPSSVYSLMADAPLILATTQNELHLAADLNLKFWIKKVLIISHFFGNFEEEVNALEKGINALSFPWNDIPWILSKGWRSFLKVLFAQSIIDFSFENLKKIEIRVVSSSQKVNWAQAFYLFAEIGRFIGFDHTQFHLKEKNLRAESLVNGKKVCIEFISEEKKNGNIGSIAGLFFEGEKTSLHIENRESGQIIIHKTDADTCALPIKTILPQAQFSLSNITDLLYNTPDENYLQALTYLNFTCVP